MLGFDAAVGDAGVGEAGDLGAAGDHPAVVTDAGTVTRVVLDRATRAVARAAAAAGVRPGVAVVLLLPLDADGVVGYVGAIRSGGVIVPLDPVLPDDYVRGIVERTGARTAIVTATTEDRARTAGLVPIVAGVDRVHGDDAGPEPVLSADGATRSRIGFTSGSSGRPKGVAYGYGDEYWGDDGTVPGGRIGLLIPLGSAAARHAVVDVVGQGATLCPYDVRARGLDDLVPFLRRHRVTNLRIPVGLFRRLLVALGDTRLEHVDVVRLTGEAIDVADLLGFQRHFRGDAVLDNRYGSTEAGNVARLVLRGDADVPPVMCYPTLLPGLDVTIEDPAGAPVAPGEWGEIVVRGGDVRGGYFDDPELTARRFFTTPDGRRGNRSGDLGRFLPDGALQVMGRVDDQVSVHGVNVHLSAVEQAIREMDGVDDAAVVPCDDGRGGTALAALVVPATWRPPTAGAVRRRVRDHLPAAAVPSVVLGVRALPRLEGGKLDRGAAAALVKDSQPLRGADAGRPPATDDEKAIAAIVADVLGLDGVAADDDFFDLGGDSLAAEELVARLTGAYGGRVTRGAVLECRSVAGLARHVRAGRARTDGLVCLQASGTGAPLFIAPGAGEEPFNLVRLVQRLGADRPVYSYRSPLYDRRALAQPSVAAAARHHLRLLRAELGDTPTLLAGYSAGAVVAFEMARRIERAGGHVALFACLDGAPPGEVDERGPAGRAMATSDAVHDALRRRDPVLLAKVLTRPARAFVRRRTFGLRRRPRLAQRAAITEHASLRQARYRPSPSPGAALLFVSEDRAPEYVESWRRWLRGPVTVQPVPGSHFRMLDEPHVAVLADHLRQALRAADTGA